MMTCLFSLCSVPVALIVEGVQLRLWLLGDGQLRCLEGDIGKGRAVPTETVSGERETYF